MSLVKVQGNVSGTGTFTIAAPNSNNDRTMTLADTDGTIYIAPGDGIQTLAAGVPTARTITAGTGISVANGTGVSGNPTITNDGVTSNVAGTGISVSGATGAVTITNSGVTSIVAGTNITISGGTGAVTISAAGGSTTYGAIGTYVISAFTASSNTTYAAGTTIAGSSLLRQADGGNNSGYTMFLGIFFGGGCSFPGLGSPQGSWVNAGLSGTWQFMSRVRNGSASAVETAALFVRIS